jgi:peptidoglycan/LPS O-acetylase OafA/YrhL
MKRGMLLLYLGLLCICAGVVLCFTVVDDSYPLWLFIVGGVMKFVYLYLAYRKGRYKPGVELLFLIAGMFILALGISIRTSNPESVFGPALVAKAIVLKAVFVCMVVRKMRQHRLKSFALPVNDARGIEGNG